MNTKELVKKYSEKLGVSEELGTGHLNTMLSVMEGALLEEDSVTLRGIGKIAPKELAAKRGLTPQGIEHRQPARLTLKIVPSGIFKVKLNANRRRD